MFNARVSFVLLSLVFECLLCLEIETKCGKEYSVSINFENIERSALIYIPSMICNEKQFTSFIQENTDFTNFDASNDIITLPILLGIHCLGCRASNEITKWKSHSETSNFILISPQGTHNSWNADQCCGMAFASKTNDIGFIQQLLTEIKQSISQTFPFISISTNNGYLFVTGFSNGGFMTDKLAWMSANGQFDRIIAATPTAGYIYDNSKYIIDGNDDKHNSIAMFIHHSRSDSFVNPEGCCSSQSQSCCCGIGIDNDVCVSIYEEFDKWLEWNNCDDMEQHTFQDMAKTTEYKLPSKQVTLNCAKATVKDNGCDVETTLCIHDNTHHTEWASSFPLSDDVIMFFMRSLCDYQNGLWNEENNDCECNEDLMFHGLHCITPKTIIPINDGNDLSVLGNAEEKFDGKSFDSLLDDNEENEVVEDGSGIIMGNSVNGDDEWVLDFGNFIQIPGKIVLLYAFLFGVIGMCFFYQKRYAKEGYKYSKVAEENFDDTFVENDGNRNKTATN